RHEAAGAGGRRRANPVVGRGVVEDSGSEPGAPDGDPRRRGVEQLAGADDLPRAGEPRLLSPQATGPRLMIDSLTFESRLRRFSRVRRGILNAALGYRLGLFGLAAGVLGLLLLSGWVPNILVNLALFGILGLWLLGLLTAWLVRRVRF